MADKFTLGMAVYDRPPNFTESVRATFTVMSALVHHPLVGEVVVVDNSPHDDNPLYRLPGQTGGRVRVVEMPEPRGTAAPRNRVFQEATFDRVAVCDPHVLLYPGTFEALSAFYAERGDDCPDVLHGPLMTEAGVAMATHMNDQWRSEMLGTWGMAWTGPRCVVPFSVMTEDDRTLKYVTLSQDRLEQQEMPAEIVAGLGLPAKPDWPGHERVLCDLGFHQPRDPFQIPGHGMGFFACRKDSWLPFHADCRGFGGEEITTGYRFRQAGRAAWCVPGAGWWHHFDRTGGGVPYRLTRWDKVRNYVVEFKSLGLDLEPIRRHFGASVPAGEWDQILAGEEWPTAAAPGVNPATFVASPVEAERRFVESGGKPLGRGGSPESFAPVPAAGMSPRAADKPAAEPGQPVDNVFALTAIRDSPIQNELPRLKFLGQHCGRGGGPGDVVEVAHQSVSSVAFLAARVDNLVSYAQPANGRDKALAEVVPAGTNYQCVHAMPGPDGVPECDLLFLDVDPHTAEYYDRLLFTHAPQSRRFLVLHDTVAYDETWNGLPGVGGAIDKFLKNNPEWAAVAHYRDQNGLLVLSRDPADEQLLADAVFPDPADSAKIVVPPTEGPGTELKGILRSVGINPSPSCDCNARASEMNARGNDWCDEHVDEVAGWLREGQDRWGWRDWLKASALAVANGIAFRLNPIDPFPGLVREAVRRSREKSK